MFENKFMKIVFGIAVSLAIGFLAVLIWIASMLPEIVEKVFGC